MPPLRGAARVGVRGLLSVPARAVRWACPVVLVPPGHRAVRPHRRPLVTRLRPVPVERLSRLPLGPLALGGWTTTASLRWVRALMEDSVRMPAALVEHVVGMLPTAGPVGVGRLLLAALGEPASGSGGFRPRSVRAWRLAVTVPPGPVGVKLRPAGRGLVCPVADRCPPGSGTGLVDVGSPTADTAAGRLPSDRPTRAVVAGVALTRQRHPFAGRIGDPARFLRPVIPRPAHRFPPVVVVPADVTMSVGRTVRCAVVFPLPRLPTTVEVPLGHAGTSPRVSLRAARRAGENRVSGPCGSLTACHLVEYSLSDRGNPIGSPRPSGGVVADGG